MHLSTLLLLAQDATASTEAAAPGAGSYALIAGGVIGGISCLILVFGLFKKLKAGRLAETPFVSTGEVASNGEAVAGPKNAISAEGDVVCDEPLTSPCSETPCLYYELEVVGSWKEGDSRKSKTYISEKVWADWAIDDGSGAVQVNTEKGASYDPLERTFSETKKEGFLADLKGLVGKNQVMQFGAYGFRNPTMSKADTFTCTERVFKTHDHIYVNGKLEDGTITKPGWSSLIVANKTRDALLGSTMKASKMAMNFGLIGLGLGVVTSGVGFVI